MKTFHYFDAGKSGLDMVMDAIGTFGGPPGFAISTAYFVLDQFIGWNNVQIAMEEANNFDKMDKEITGSGIWERPKF